MPALLNSNVTWRKIFSLRPKIIRKGSPTSPIWVRVVRAAFLTASLSDTSTWTRQSFDCFKLNYRQVHLKYHSDVTKDCNAEFFAVTTVQLNFDHLQWLTLIGSPLPPCSSTSQTTWTAAFSSKSQQATRTFLDKRAHNSNNGKGSLLKHKLISFKSWILYFIDNFIHYLLYKYESKIFIIKHFEGLILCCEMLMNVWLYTPSFDSCNAKQRPMPCPAPVTTATWKIYERIIQIADE